jgi:heme A synthase
VARKRRRLKAADIALRIFFFVAGSLMVGFLTVFLDAELGDYMPRHFSVSIAVGLAVAFTFWLLRLLKHPPLLLRNVSPWAAGLCAGLGVHIAKLWLK